MPTIKYPKNPNVDTVFVEQDDGTKSRALSIAPQDISTLELPNNPNSTKGYITVDGKKQRVILTADITGGGGGSSLPDQTGHSGEFLTTDGTDASWSAISALQNTATGTNSLTVLGTPSTAANATNICVGSTASATGALAIGRNTNASANNAIALGLGATASAAYAIQIGFGASNNVANTVKIGNQNGNFEIMSADGTIPTARLTNAINKYSSMPTASADYLGQIAQFTGTTDATYTHGYIYECVSDGGNPATYSWTAVSVQAGGSSLPSQTGNSGKFLTTDGTDASWGNALVNNVNSEYSLALLNSATASSNGVGIGWKANGNGGVAIGEVSKTVSSVAVGARAQANSNYSIALGNYAQVASAATGAIQIGCYNSSTTINSDANTFKVGNANGNFEIMDANGNLPVARLASITGLADGNYKLRLTMASGVPTLSWVAE